MRPRLQLLAILLLSFIAPGQAETAASVESLSRNLQGHLSFFASDALRGRGSATRDEEIAATYVGSQFLAFGLQPINGTMVQRVRFKDRKGLTRNTYNAWAVLPGSDPELKQQVVLLTAHLDHIGVGKPVNGDAIYNGADDDASGVAAVLELARALARSDHRPRRTVLFVCFGSEELGGYGNQAFLQNPPVPLKDIVANLEFEMIGRPDAAVKHDELWLTGWERSDLGPELAKHGAKLVRDPHPEQKFFTRSDNFALAKRGIVAQTVSSFGLGNYYHQPSDDLQHIDMHHLTDAVRSLLEPVEWLVNTDWTPRWVDGMKP